MARSVRQATIIAAEAGYPVSYSGAIKVLVTEQQLSIDRGLVYHPRTLVAGVGCERGTPASDVIDLIAFALKSENLSPKSLAAIATVVRDPAGPEHVLLSDGVTSLRLDLVNGSLLAGPVCLTYRLAGLAALRGPPRRGGGRR